MINKFILVFIISAVATAAVTKLFIPALKKLNVAQPILKYLEEHYSKSGTPTMGGAVFVLTSAIIFLIAKRGGVLSLMAAVIFIAYAIVGFIDDFIKIKFGKNEGLTPMQKIIFQLAVGVLSAIFCIKRGVSSVYVPFTDKLYNIGFWFAPLAIVVFVATTNCVNLTDGLDGLAGGTSAIFLIISAFLILFQMWATPAYYVDRVEYEDLALFSITIGGALTGFLLFNVNKAGLFMGDTGSLSLGGAMAAVMLFSGNVFYIPVMGIMFVLSGISVILQVIHYKRTKKRIFLMAPLHHHFQHKGYNESKIAYAYSFITLIVGLSCLMIYC